MDLQQLRGHRVDRRERLEQLVVGPVVTGRPQPGAAELARSGQRQQAGRAQLRERLRGELGALVELTRALADPVGQLRDRLQPRNRLPPPGLTGDVVGGVHLQLSRVGLVVLTQLRVGAQERVTAHVGAVAAGGRLASERLGEAADVVRPGAAADAEVVDAELVGLARRTPRSRSGCR